MQPPTSPGTPGSTGTPSRPDDTAATRTDSIPTGMAIPLTGDLHLPSVIGGRYRIEELRGGGGMAKVYRGVDLTLEREVAVKLINPELRSDAEFDARFQREARIASQLSDPHIVVVHDYGLDAVHGPYLVMEYLVGLSLRERLTAEGPLPLKAGLQLAGQLLLALIHAHDKGVVHRDIKPDNVFLLSQSGIRLHTRVLDFGIARIYRDDPDNQNTALTSAGAVLGTPRYMAPEQLAGQAVDARTDLYAAGLVIFESLTGHLPYVQSKKLCELCPEATPHLEALLERCLARVPGDRPKGALEVYLQLQELGKASGVLLLPPGALSKLVASRRSHDSTVTYTNAPASRSRRKWIAGAAVVALLVVLGLLGRWLFFTPTFPPGPESLHGIQIGDDQDAVVKREDFARASSGNPWKNARMKEHIGHVLRPEDLGLSEAELGRLSVSSTKGDLLHVLFHDEKVVAVITTQRKVLSNRSIGYGSESGKVQRAYEDQLPTLDTATLPAGGHVEVHRYRALGIGFETRGGKVVGMALFPPRP